MAVGSDGDGPAVKACSDYLGLRLILLQPAALLLANEGLAKA
jgi:hypothetical protein